MHGVPANLDLSVLHGAELVQVCLGIHQIELHFHPFGSISVEGDWELIDRDGHRIDGRAAEPRDSPYQLHQLLGRIVEGTEIDPPTSFSIRFNDGLLLRVFAEVSAYEDVSIQPGDIVM